MRDMRNNKISEKTLEYFILNKNYIIQKNQEYTGGYVKLSEKAIKNFYATS